LWYGIDSLEDTTGITLYPENQGQGVLKYFDDFDDFNGFEIRDSSLLGTLGNYRSRFRVYYVKPDSIERVSPTRTFTKRMDIMIWRETPPGQDTFRVSTVMGYWLFTAARE